MATARRRFAGRAAAVLLGALTASSSLLACSKGELGEWVPMRARQLAVPLVAGAVTVEVHDTVEGWTERMEVLSDGRKAVGGVEIEPLERAPEPALDPERAAFFRDQVGAAVDPAAPTLERAAALRDWVSRRTFGGEGGGAYFGPDERPPGAEKGKPKSTARSSEDGREVLADIDRGGTFTCLSVATILHDAARAFGLRTRRCDMTVRHMSNESHAVVEVWSEADGRWVVMDPTFNCSFEVDGRPAGAMDLHEAVVSRRFTAVRAVRRKGAAGRDPWESGLNPVLYYRNLYLHLPSGKWLTRVDDATPAAPVAGATFLHTDSDQAFRTGGDPLEGLEVRRGALHGRVAFQAVGGMLYVCLADGLFEFGRLEARATRGLDVVFHGDRPALDADDPFLFAPGDMLPNGRMEDGDGDGAPDGWTVTGASAVSRVDGGVAVEAAGGPCDIVWSDEIEPVPVAAFARLRVERGGASFELRTRRETDASQVGPGPPTAVSSRIMTTGRGSVTIRIALRPGTRCVVEHVSMRRALRLRDWS